MKRATTGTRPGAPPGAGDRPPREYSDRPRDGGREGYRSGGFGGPGGDKGGAPGAYQPRFGGGDGPRGPPARP